MEMISYDICFLIPKDRGENFGIVGLQIDNSLNVRLEIFINKEKIEIIKVKFKAKSWTIFETGILEDFNGCCIIIQDKSIIVV